MKHEMGRDWDLAAVIPNRIRGAKESVRGSFQIVGSGRARTRTGKR